MRESSAIPMMSTRNQGWRQTPLSLISLLNSSEKCRRGPSLQKQAPSLQLTQHFEDQLSHLKSEQLRRANLSPLFTIFLETQETTLMRMQGIISRVSSLTSTCEKMSKKSTVT